MDREERTARGHRRLRARGKGPQTPRARRPLRARLRDTALALSVIVLAGGSLLPSLATDPFAAVAPIQAATDPLTTASIAAPVESTDSAPLAIASEATPTAGTPVAALGEPRGAVAETGGSGGMKVIEIAPETRRPVGPIVVRDPSDQRQALRVAHLPDRALLDDSGAGPLPVQTNGRRPLDVYAGRWSGKRGNRIAIIVGGLGISQTGTAQAIEALPGKVTLAFSSAGNSLKRWQQAARRNGHELLLQVPMQGFDQSGEGPFGRRLTLDASPAENAERLRRSLGRMTNYVGVVNYTGGAFQSDSNVLGPVMAEVRDRGLMYVDDGTVGQSLAAMVAREESTPFASGDIVIDLDRDPKAMAKQLGRLEDLARSTGSAIGTATAFPESIETISRWIKSAESRGVEVVPVSALARDPGRGR